MPAKKGILFFSYIILTIHSSFSQPAEEADICVYGGTSAGIIAGYTAKQLHKKVIVIEPGNHLGGLTTGGLGYTDIGNKYAITGLAKDFYRRIGRHYGKLEQWIFEPSVAAAVFQQYISKAHLPVQTGYRLQSVQKTGTRITSIRVQKGTASLLIKAKMFIDCSYEGDLMAGAGVSYIVGREDNNTYHETYNGVQLREKHQFPDGIDPYKVPGKPESGLLWGISAEQPAAQGSGDHKVQAYNFRICLTDNPDNLVPITRPEGYDSSRYELLLRVLEKRPANDLWGFLKFDLMPNHKTDINNNGAFSTDMIGMNYNYAEADYNTRQQIIAMHEQYTKGLLYFIGHDNRMPGHLRNAMLRWGYPKDEYINNGHWSPQLYIREARRMIGAYVMTQANCEGREVISDAIGMAAYTMDSHNCTRLVVNGMVKNEGDVQIGGFGPYPIAYRSIIPRATECTNLFVPVCLSASHIAYGSIRMEPVFMALAQAAATAAAISIDTRSNVQNTDVKKVQQLLLQDPLVNGSTPEIIVDNDDSLHTKVTGTWKRSQHGSYGPSMFTSENSNDEKQSVRFEPVITNSGTYHLYTYMPRLAGMAPEMTITIFNGSRSRQVTVATASVKIEGQTSGEWIDLGKEQFIKGKGAYIEIHGKGSGITIADAVLLVPGE